MTRLRGDDPTDSGDTAWVLTSSALVMMMTPSLAMFYGGFVSEKAVVNTMMMSFASLAVISIIWSLITFSLAFGPNDDASVDPWLGSYHFGIFDSSDKVAAHTDIPEHAFFMFQMMFATITCAVISGSVVQRISLWAWVTFTVFWHFLCYVPLARWIFYQGGWLASWGTLDFAGGMVVETASGVSGLVLAYWIGPSASSTSGHGPQPHNVPFILLGAGLLFFGWFGFNAGSALMSGYLSARAFANTHLAACAACCGWGVAEWIWSGWRAGGKLFTGKVSAVGAATGVIVGLVAITPACGFVSQMDSVLIGFVTALIVYHLSHLVHHNSGVDDTLDCFGGHGLSGILGTLWTGLWANTAEGSPVDGAFYGNPALFGKQLAGVLVTIAVCVVGTTVAFFCTATLARVFGMDMRIPLEAGDASVDDLLHGEKAYVYHDSRSNRSRGWSLASLLGREGHNSHHGGHAAALMEDAHGVA